jgi:hypothetical protein
VEVVNFPPPAGPGAATSETQRKIVVTPGAAPDTSGLLRNLMQNELLRLPSNRLEAE